MSYEPEERHVGLVATYLRARVAIDPEWSSGDPAQHIPAGEQYTPDEFYATAARSFIVAEHHKGGIEGVQGFLREAATWLRANTGRS